MTTSSVPTVVERLYNRLNASTPKQVLRQPPKDKMPSEGHIYLGDVVDGRHEIPTVRGSARKPRQETYSIEVYLEASGREAATVDTLVFGLLAFLEDELANDPTIGLSATYPTLVVTLGSWSRERHPSTQTSGGIRAQIRALVDVSVRLT